MISTIVEYFTLNRRERNAVIAVLSLLFILLGVKYYVVYCYKITTPQVAVIELDELASKLSAQENNVSGKSKTTTHVVTTGALFSFDPNAISYEQALQLGFTERQAHMLVNYRNKGGKFYTAESLKKLYGMDDVLYQKIAPYIVIENSNSKNEFKTENKIAAKKQNISVEINSADSLTWIQLRGIKGGRARMILKYKSMLGGFYKTEQLKEVYSFTDSLYNSIKENLTVNAALIQKIKVNTADFKMLVHHPYIKYEGAKCIFALKKNKKIAADDLKNSSCFSREQLEKVLVYLDFAD